MPADIEQTIRAQRIAALQARRATLEGAARRALDERLATLHAEALPARPGTGRTEDPSAAAGNPASLQGLVAHIASETPHRRKGYPELPALDEFRRLWSTLHADRQLQQSMAHTPTDAGPLNSAALASRAIALMRACSPGYLRAFLAYVDDLAWLEQLGHAGAGASHAPVRRRSRRKPDT